MIHVKSHWPSWQVLPVHPGGQRHWNPPGASWHVAPCPQGLRSHCFTAGKRENTAWTTGLCNGNVCMNIKETFCVSVNMSLCLCDCHQVDMCALNCSIGMQPVFSVFFCCSGFCANSDKYNHLLHVHGWHLKPLPERRDEQVNLNKGGWGDKKEKKKKHGAATPGSAPLKRNSIQIKKQGMWGKRPQTHRERSSHFRG